VQRDLLGPLAIALLCVVAIAVASATLTDPVTTAGFDRDVGDGGDVGDGDQWNPLTLNTSDGDEASDDGGSGPMGIATFCFPLLSTLRVKLLALLLLVVLSYELYRKMGTIGVAAGVAAVLPPGLLVYTFLTDCGRPEASGGGWSFMQGNVSNQTGVGGAGGSGGGAAAVDPPIALLLFGAVVVVLLVAAFVRSTGDDAEEEPEPEPEPEDTDLAAVGDVAGEAADRIEGPADVENEVYRAWREMTGLLDVASPESSTPAEFEAAALGAGMSRSEVATLTDVFREVRYGGREPTPDREERAVEALRAIEDAHAEEGRV
jgi:hypothetical protein